MWAFIAYGRERGKKKLFRFSPRKKVGELFTFQVDYCQKERSMGNTAFPKGGREEKFHLLVGFAFSAAIWKLSFLVVRGAGRKEGRMGHLPSFLPSTPE